jgi:predicted MFS family arabinose efflux permease
MLGKLGKCVTTVFAGLGVSFLIMIIWCLMIILPDPPYAPLQEKALFYMTRPMMMMLTVAIISWILGMFVFAEYLFRNTTLNHAKQTPTDH